MKSEFLIKNLGKVITGNTPSKLNREFYDSNDIHFIKPDLISYSTITKIYNSNEYLSEKARYKARIVPKHTVLVTCIGNIGKVGYVTLDEVAFNQQINAIITNDLVLPRYLAYALIANQKQLEAIANAPVVPLINKTQFENFSLSIHNDIEEQAKVINILDKLSNIIELKKVELNEYDQLIKSRFGEMFGDGSDGICKVKTLGEFCKFQQGTQVPIEDQISEHIAGYKRFLRIIDYTQAPQPPRYVSVKGREIKKDSVVIVRYGASAGFIGHGYDGILANNLFEIVPEESVISKDFLYYALKYGNFQQIVRDKAFGAAMPALSFGMMNNIVVVTPDFEYQEHFLEFAQQVDKLKFEVQKSLDESQMLFDSLMQEYFG
jgi:type I restriction enzyme S subunit